MSRLKASVLIVPVAALLGACGSEETPTDTKMEPLAVAAFPPGSAFKEVALVELKASRPAQIYYTIDGQDPNGATKQLYDEPIVLDHDTMVQFIAVSDDGVWSPPVIELYSLAMKDLVPPDPLARDLIMDRDIFFFTANVGEEEALENTFMLKSQGFAAVHIDGIYVDVNPHGWGYFEDGAFELVDPPTEAFDLAPGETIPITVRYKPTMTLRGAALIVYSNDQRHEDGLVIVDLWGRVLTW